MHKALAIVAASTVMLATPALAQVGGVADINVGGQVGVNPAGTLGAATDRLGATVDQVDGTVNKTVDATNLSLAVREDVRAGVEIRDTSGNSVGTVQSVEGDVAVVVRGGKLYNVPLSGIYRDASNVTGGLVTKVSRAEIAPRAEAGASVESR